MTGDIKFQASQDLPDFPYARFAEECGLMGIRVDRPEQVGDAWDIALRADRPVIIEAITDPDVPPMGARFRLKAGFDITGYPADVQVILTAMKRYGIILADNGSDWYLSGAPDERWDNDTLHTLGLVTGSSFEAVDESGLMAEAGSGRVK